MQVSFRVTIKVMSDKLNYFVNAEQKDGVNRNFLHFRNLLLCHRRMKFNRRKLGVFMIKLCGFSCAWDGMKQLADIVNKTYSDIGFTMPDCTPDAHLSPIGICDKQL